MGNKVLIIGAGSRGQTIARVLRRQNAEINFWDKDFRKNIGLRPLVETVPAAEFIFLCVPTWEMRSVMIQIVTHIKADTIVILLAKGIEENKLQFMDELAADILPLELTSALFAGPIRSEELNRGQTGIGVFASPKGKSAFIKTLKLFEKTRLHLEYVSDVHGVAIAAALKNIYAIGLGIVDGFGWGVNIKGWFIATAIDEMIKITELLGGRRETVLGLAGVGDLMATGFSAYSHNRQAGYDIATTGTPFFRSEGISSIKPLIQNLKGESRNFLFLRALERVIIHQEKPFEVFNTFINRTR